MIEIIPAILPKDFEEIELKLEKIKGLARAVQIDICDGKFVSSRTWPFAKEGVVDKRFDKILEQEERMPYFEDFSFEFDLMVNDPYLKIADFVTAGASRIVVHLESAGDDEIISIVEDYGKISKDFAGFGIGIGLGVKSSSDRKRITRFAKDFHFVQVMGIKNVGFQRQSLDEDSIKLIKSLREEFEELAISVDGGVNMETASLFIEAGADRLVVGSAIFDNEDPKESLKHLQSL